MKSRNQTTDLFNRFSRSREGKGAKKMATLQPTDPLEFLCWLDACGERRRTLVHDVDCEPVEADTILESCKEGYAITDWLMNPCEQITFLS